MNEETNEFTRRGEPTVIGVPEGYKQDFNSEWTAMPDFNKIIPMPESLMIELHSGVETAVKKFLNMGYSSHPLLAAMEKSSRSNAKGYDDLDEKDKAMFDQAVNNVKEHGYMYWYDWRIDNWGTKWGGYDYKQINDNTFEFDTAWSGVPELMESISLQFPDVMIEYKWSDEDTGSNCGHIIFKNGVFKEYDIENGSLEAYELAFELRPDYKRYYKLVDGNYEYDEDEE